MGTVKWGILGAAKIAREQVIPAMKKVKILNYMQLLQGKYQKLKISVINFQ